MTTRYTDDLPAVGNYQESRQGSGPRREPVMTRIIRRVWPGKDRSRPTLKDVARYAACWYRGHEWTTDGRGEPWTWCERCDVDMPVFK